MSERSDNRQHFAVAVLSLWLIGTSPWIAMLRRIPAGAGWLDYAHVILGIVTLAFAVTYTWACTRQGRWRLYFPLSPQLIGGPARDLRGLFRGQIPAAESGGLFGLIEGLLLVALALTAASGAAWFLALTSAASCSAARLLAISSSASGVTSNSARHGVSADMPISLGGYAR